MYRSLSRLAKKLRRCGRSMFRCGMVFMVWHGMEISSYGGRDGTRNAVPSGPIPPRPAHFGNNRIIRSSRPSFFPGAAVLFCPIRVHLPMVSFRSVPFLRDDMHIPSVHRVFKGNDPVWCRPVDPKEVYFYFHILSGLDMIHRNCAQLFPTVTW